MRTFLRRAILAAVSAAVLPAALLAAPGTALAGGPPVTVHIISQAALQPDESAVLTMKYSCPPFAGSLQVGLQQTALAVLVEATPLCDGAIHTLNVDVPGPFTPGDAEAVATLFDGNLVATSQATVKVK